MRNPARRPVGLLLFVLSFFGSARGAFGQSDWTTWGYDQERTGWNKAETTLNKDNVSRLELKWTAQLSTPTDYLVLSTITAPLVVTATTPQGPAPFVIVVGSDNSVYAIHADTGKVAWQRKFPNDLTPKNKPDAMCSNTQNATPVVDKSAQIVYLNTTDGKIRGLNLLDGEDRMPPTSYIPEFARNWSFNLVDNVVYTSLGRGCNGATAQVDAMDMSDPSRHLATFFTGAARIGGAWGRGGPVRGPKGIYVQTSDGAYDPATAKFGNTVMALNFKDLRLVDSFTPADWKDLNAKDLDFGSANPLIFPFKNWTLVASAGKQTVLYLLDANNLGGADHHTPLYQSLRWGNDILRPFGMGVWGAMASWEDPSGNRWILMPMWGPPAKDAPAFKYTYGDADNGSVMAFQVVVENDKPAIVPMWRSRDMHVPDPPVVANGVVYALQTGENTTQRVDTPKTRVTPITNAVLYAYDAETGKELFSSKESINSWVHFSEPVVANGMVYVSTWDARVYAFGLK
ncbi:MAG: PQQ-binding-like beta-propeller repeat protein [Candidatus Acidiferrales bacterium]|jgi:outer membrane protein assembly factor BamB